jgi:hypothetical protein
MGLAVMVAWVSAAPLMMGKHLASKRLQGPDARQPTIHSMCLVCYSMLVITASGITPSHDHDPAEGLADPQILSNLFLIISTAVQQVLPCQLV